jgi:hypothetical protein
MLRPAARRFPLSLHHPFWKRATHLLGPLLLGALVAASATLAAPPAACACSCEPTDLAARSDAAAAVFEGRVRAVAREGSAEVGPSRLRVTLEVVQTWKGADAEEIVVTTMTDSAACGVPFEPGRSYLVFAASDGANALSTGLCGGTKPREEADEDVAALGAGVTPVEVQDAPARARTTPPGAGGCASCHIGAASGRARTTTGLGALMTVGVLGAFAAARRRSRSRRRARAPRDLSP